MIIQGDTGGRELFSRYAVEWFEWHDAGALLDIDTENDYQRLLGGEFWTNPHGKPPLIECQTYAMFFTYYMCDIIMKLFIDWYIMQTDLKKIVIIED